MKDKQLQYLLLGALTALFAFKILFWSSALPFFGNVDEKAHFDLITKYGAGQSYLNASLEYSNHSLALIPKYQSSDYLLRPEKNAAYSEALNIIFSKDKEVATNSLKQEKNYQNNSPPLYYIVMGSFYNIIGISPESSLSKVFLLRMFSGLFSVLCFLSILIFVQSKWGNESTIGFALLFLAIPQGNFYFLNNDVFSPLLITLSILVTWKRTKYWQIIAALFMALAVFNKLTNLPFVLLPLLAFNYRTEAKKMLGYLLSLLLLTLPFFLFNYYKTNTLTANAEKLNVLAWAPNSFEGIINHPISSPVELFKFIQMSSISFLRGEISYQLYPVSPPWLDLTLFVGFITGLLLMLVFYKKHSLQVKTSFIGMVLGFLFLVFLSLAFEYTNSIYPSKEFPFFYSGRVMVGIFPIIIVGIYFGLEGLANKFKLKPWWFLIPICILFNYFEYKSLEPFIDSGLNLISLSF